MDTTYLTLFAMLCKVCLIKIWKNSNLIVNIDLGSQLISIVKQTCKSNFLLHFMSCHDINACFDEQPKLKKYVHHWHTKKEVSISILKKLIDITLFYKNEK
jgi:hypothetical protein